MFLIFGNQMKGVIYIKMINMDLIRSAVKKFISHIKEAKEERRLRTKHTHTPQRSVILYSIIC